MKRAFQSRPGLERSRPAYSPRASKRDDSWLHSRPSCYFPSNDAGLIAISSADVACAHRISLTDVYRQLKLRDIVQREQLYFLEM